MECLLCRFIQQIDAMMMNLKKRLKFLGVIKRKLIVVHWKTGRAIHFFKYHNFDRFIFIHINKTGGSSIEKALKIPTDHKTALEKIEEIGQQAWQDKFTFTVVRNPWDKVVSQYAYRLQTDQTDLRQNSIGFREWVKRTYRDQDPRYFDTPQMFLPQTDWITDEMGKILVDKIIHFENLAVEFNQVMEMLGKNTTLPHVKKSDRGDYREYYDAETIEIIRDWFEQDIERFDYQF